MSRPIDGAVEAPRKPPAAGSTEAARLGGIRSAEVRRRKATLRADLRARQQFSDTAEAVAKEMLDAALGRGKWQTNGVPVLDAKERLAALKTCLEYGVGRPRAQDAISQDLEDEPQDGIRFGVREGDVQGEETTTPDATPTEEPNPALH